jgi:hypothetical protein
LKLTSTPDLARDPGVAPTPLPAGIGPNGSNWWFSLNFSRNFGGALGKNLAGSRRPRHGFATVIKVLAL